MESPIGGRGRFSDYNDTTFEELESAKWDDGDDTKRPLIRVREVRERRNEDKLTSKKGIRRFVPRNPLRAQRLRRTISSSSDDYDSEEKEFDPKDLLKQPGWKRRAFLGFVVFTLAAFGVLHIINFFIGLGPGLWDDGRELWLDSWSRPGHMGDGLAKYPTDFTRGVLPIPCHSHNDYWRRVPLFEAIHFGCTGTEADVWIFDQELYVGHDTASLHPNRTLQTLYVDPIVAILDKQNPHNQFNNHSSMHTPRGVFDEDPSQTLVLLIDFKNDGRLIFPYVQEHLRALREKNYLTYFNGNETINGPVTVVATGNAPFDLLTANQTYRDIFFDAPLDKMWEAPRKEAPTSSDSTTELAELYKAADSSLSSRKWHLWRRNAGQGQEGTNEESVFDSTNSYYASVNFKRTIGHKFRGRLSEQQIELIRGQIQGAKKRGLKARYWSTPKWPISLRNHVWEVLINEGADYLNVDDLRGAARTDWTKNRHGDYHGRKRSL